MLGIEYITRKQLAAQIDRKPYVFRHFCFRNPRANSKMSISPISSLLLSRLPVQVYLQVGSRSARNKDCTFMANFHLLSPLSLSGECSLPAILGVDFASADSTSPTAWTNDASSMAECGI